MVKFKTKNDKHANDNEKRCKSIKNKEKVKLHQSQIIKQALSNSSLSNKSSKKIVFSDDHNHSTANVQNGNQNGASQNGKSSLFGNSDSEDENFEIKEKTQFQGKKGFELLNLQSTYGNDERFRIDERFLEKEKDEELANETKNTVADEEKTKQLKILESVLGTSCTSPEKETKTKKRTYEMIRYDVSNENHKIYEKEIPSDPKSSLSFKQKKEKKKISKTDQEEVSKPKVSKDKFHEVSSDIKNRFKEKSDSQAQFSLLQTYGLNEFGKSEEVEEVDKKKKSREDNGNNHFDNKMNEIDCDFDEALQKEEEMALEEPKVKDSTVVAKGIWKESFFFLPNDERFKEGLEFINKKGSTEAEEAAENYDKTRRKLREILRLHVKKQMRKKDPFKNKIGGMNKKQLANSKLRNSRVSTYKKKNIKKGL